MTDDRGPEGHTGTETETKTGSVTGGESDRDPEAVAELGYRSMTEERSLTLSVEGDLPEWLDGTFVRNGPGRFDVDGRTVTHWFDGLAMLRRFRFDDGGVEYANRFLRTDAFEAARSRDGRFGTGTFAETPDRGPVAKLRAALRPEPTDNANAGVARIAGRYVALTESPRLVGFDPATLRTRDELQWEDDLPPGHTTPHLLPDPAGEGHLGYLTTFLPRSAYHLFRIPPETPVREPVARIPVENPAYMHSFAATPEYVVLTEMPFVLPPLRAISGGDDPLIRRFEWRPQQLTRFLVVERSTGDVVAEHRVPPFVTFHHVNAVRADEELLVDLVAFDSPSVLTGMRVERLRSGVDDGTEGRLRRYRLPLDGDSASAETVATDLAMPTVRTDRTGRSYRYCYAQDTRDAGPPRGIAKVDVEAGERRTWRGDGYPSEPVFVPNPAGAREDDGALLVESLLPDRQRSELVVLDASDLRELARAPTPHPIPFGFHGRYFPDVG